MKKLASVFLFAALALFAGKEASAQVVVGVAPVAPACAYGYYDYYPYACAPYGFYDSDWFVGGVFIGAGPWYGGRYNFHYHPGGHYGYGYHSHPGFAYHTHVTTHIVIHGGGGFHGGRR
jgi:hypothetical protein